jgi:hypothetical protein
MSKKNFEAYLKKQALKKTEIQQLDWNKRKEAWFKYIDEFYHKIQKWLNPYLKQEQVKITFKPVTLNEEFIGSYETKQLYLSLGNQQIVFSPIGTIHIIGAKGRIDMEGSTGKVRFILVNKDSPGPLVSRSLIDESSIKSENEALNWKIATPPPAIQFLDLNEESFFDALMEILNG